MASSGTQDKRFEDALGVAVGAFILAVADHDLEQSIRLSVKLSKSFHPFNVLVYMATVIRQLMETIKGDEWRSVLNYEMNSVDIDRRMAEIIAEARQAGDDTTTDN